MAGKDLKFTPDELEWREFIKWASDPAARPEEAEARIIGMLKRGNRTAVLRMQEQARLDREPHAPRQPSSWGTSPAKYASLVAGITSKSEYFGLWRDQGS
ncbi:hypothetical protein [Ramlibacter montanisoli]|uniref:Uncharacterized protein n=1 Tax=Ramlibacter montanisoli TaxID=2732512 RepID=A0A849KFZ5_9BURK|nr:hypothetical protein [Ramlibacter montanisoli]NNU43581.1 hypothetical protein [Ramlibacter montanisoli]